MRVAKRATPSPVFGMRFLTEEELQGAVIMGCLGNQTPEGSIAVPVSGPGPVEAAGSFSIRLCGDGGDTDSGFEESPLPTN